MEEDIVNKIRILINAHKQGLLGGEIMPEDENPGYANDTKECYLYFTLPMALNYQRNSYKLWEAAKKSASDLETKDIFDPFSVVSMDLDELKEKLTKHKVALQPNKQPLIWKKLCETFVNKYNGDIREFFKDNGNIIKNIKTNMISNKKDFPYLSGNKIMNYWLYVMTQYTNAKLLDKENITVAPDTHVIQASLRLGIINEDEFNLTDVQTMVVERWEDILRPTEFNPIDIHTPLWLWSRNGFKKLW